MKRWQSTFEAAGFAAIISGIWMIYVPAAVIIAGAVLVLAGNARLR